MNQGRPNQALEQTRDSVLRYGEVVGCELLNFFVRCNMRNPITFLPILIVTLGCSVGGGAFPANKATINDVAVRSTEDVGYRVVSVDGKPCERAASRYVSVVPLVLVDQGEHELSIEAKDAGSALPPLKVKATVEPGKRYRFAKDGESVVVVEEQK